MLDAFMGFFYTLFMTLVILYAMKLVRFIFRPKGGWTAGFAQAGESDRWKLEATPQHLWRRPK